MDVQEVGTIFTAGQVRQMLDDLARALLERHPNLGEVALVGIRTGGAYLAYRLRGHLAALAGRAPDTGVMDITLYRDDWTRLHSRPKVGKTEIEFAIDGRVVVLVDDVIYTGRTIRAALDALIDFGRPQRIELLALIDRGQRELPIQPDYVGARVSPQAGQVIDVVLAESGAPGDAVVSRPA
ncbi:MAG: bifunctional pyr operon transcriptional regulator/uracil phosphoribosyltransferase PyrR [Desulfarculus sp.]|nr:bifunctional pyr operon transcriptional regulator/uracil phosphoribosyltransferase PyrR [Desulfarculus sp.]